LILERLRESPGGRFRAPKARGAYLAVPAFGWFLWFLMVPLAIVVLYSVFQRGTYGGVVYTPTLQNFARTFDPLYMQIVWNSLVIATLTTFFSLLLGYPMAYVMATARPWTRGLLVFLLVIPFMTNFVVRAYALKVVFSQEGPINFVLMSLGWISEPLAMTNSSASVLMGMVVNYLPFMVLPLFVVLERFDFSLLEAARDLGANSFAVVTKVLLPLSKPGIVTGSVLVFMPALGEFVIPDLFGGSKTMLIGNLITEQFLKARDWPFGSALSVVLLVVVIAGMWLQRRATKEEII
jgi:spermidine/putrescine transport system permease protein